jgi:hypothetical protein
MGLTEQQLYALRRKLDSLGYSNPLDPVSGPLVQKLVDDLVATTDALRNLKLQSARQAQELAGSEAKVGNSQHQKLRRPSSTQFLKRHRGGSQVEALKADSVKLSSENSQLHLLLIKAQEGGSRHDKESYQQIKKLEERIAELTYWKQTAMDRIQAAERENSGLRAKVSELVKLTDQLTAGQARWDWMGAESMFPKFWVTKKLHRSGCSVIPRNLGPCSCSGQDHPCITTRYFLLLVGGGGRADYHAQPGCRTCAKLLPCPSYVCSAKALVPCSCACGAFS